MTKPLIIMLVLAVGCAAIGCSSGETDVAWIEYPSEDAGLDAAEQPELPAPLETGTPNTQCATPPCDAGAELDATTPDAGK